MKKILMIVQPMNSEQVFDLIVHSLLTEMKNCYRAVRSLKTKFAFLWKYLLMEEITRSCPETVERKLFPFPHVRSFCSSLPSQYL